MTVVTRERGRNLGRRTVVYLFFGFLQRGLSFLLLPFVTRVMTPNEYGAVSVVVAGGALFGIVLGSSLESAVFRSVARISRSSAATLRITALYLYLILPAAAGILALVLYLLDSSLLSVDTRIWAIEILACGLMPAVSFYVLPALRASNDLRRFVVVSSVSVFALFLGKIVFVIFLGQGLFGWVVSDLLAACLSYLVGFLLVRPAPARVSGRKLRRLVAFALPLVPHRVAFWALSSLSRPAMTIVLPLSLIGIYSLAFNFASIAAMILVELNRSFLAEYSRETFPAPSSVSQRVARIQILCAFLAPAAVGAGVAIAAPIVMGEEFLASLPLIALLLTAQTAYGIYLIPVNYMVQSAGLSGWSWISSTLGAILILFCTIMFGTTTGVFGVALITMLGYLAMAVSAFTIARLQALDIRWSALSLPVSSAVLAILATFISFIALMGESQSLRALIGSFGLLVAVLALVTGRSVFRSS